jgi:hypothetical protein
MRDVSSMDEFLSTYWRGTRILLPLVREEL